MEEADLPIERAPTRCQSRFLTLMLENVNGPKETLTDGRSAAMQLPQSGRCRRSAAFWYGQ